MSPRARRTSQIFENDDCDLAACRRPQNRSVPKVVTRSRPQELSQRRTGREQQRHAKSRADQETAYLHLLSTMLHFKCLTLPYFNSVAPTVFSKAGLSVVTRDPPAYPSGRGAGRPTSHHNDPSHPVSSPAPARQRTCARAALDHQPRPAADSPEHLCPDQQR